MSQQSDGTTGTDFVAYYNYGHSDGLATSSTTFDKRNLMNGQVEITKHPNKSRGMICGWIS